MFVAPQGVEPWPKQFLKLPPLPIGLESHWGSLFDLRIHYSLPMKALLPVLFQMGGLRNITIDGGREVHLPVL